MADPDAPGSVDHVQYLVNYVIHSHRTDTSLEEVSFNSTIKTFPHHETEVVVGAVVCQPGIHVLTTLVVDTWKVKV